MAFFCLQCGECCSHMGQVYSIEEELGSFCFRISNIYTGQMGEVAVSPEMRNLYRDTGIFESWPEACPFIRKDPSRGTMCCTVHETRPVVCREFACWTLLILNSGGEPAGRVLGGRNLSTGDPVLKEFWERQIHDLDAPDDGAWEREAIRILKKAGYSMTH